MLSTLPFSTRDSIPRFTFSAVLLRDLVDDDLVDDTLAPSLADTLVNADRLVLDVGCLGVVVLTGVLVASDFFSLDFFFWLDCFEVGVLESGDLLVGVGGWWPSSMLNESGPFSVHTLSSSKSNLGW